MIKKYVYGNPVETQAVVEKMEVSTEPLEELTWDQKSFQYTMKENTAVYGLGEANRGINKRGYKYVSFCSDEPSHTEEKESLYGAHNFLVIADEEPFGIFIDNPGKVTFDIGYERYDRLTITPKYTDMYLYIIKGEGIEDIIRQFRSIIGKSYVAPKWAFGFGQCRWSYETKEQVEDVIRQYEENDMLLTSVYLDIDYMQDYKDFTVNEERFPGFKSYVEQVREKGIRLVPIIDAGVKIEKGYPVYEEGVEKNYFVKDENGEDFIAAVWPGYTHFPDFLNKEARAWFGQQYQFLIDQGIEGFWNDMNEPAIFYSKKKVEAIKKKLSALDFDNQEQDEKTEKVLLDEIRWELSELANNREDYESMIHNMDGVKVNHDKVHNLFGYMMSRAAGEAFEKLSPDKKILMFSRASYIGMHRYSGIWMGDNCSWWSHILLNLKMLPGLNMCGFMFVGADTGGFGCNTTEDLLMRWMALSVFTPLFRNHAALGTRYQECYRFTRTKDFKNILDVRYRLLPWLYEEYEQAVEENRLMFKPLAFEYPKDEIAVATEDQLLIGDDLMIAPVYTQNAIGRSVYLPENMLFVKIGADGEIITERLLKGIHFVKIALNEVPFFVREGRQMKLVKQSVITDPALRKSIMECSIEYGQDDFEVLS